jgi:hypothetical protein
LPNPKEKVADIVVRTRSANAEIAQAIEDLRNQLIDLRQMRRIIEAKPITEEAALADVDAWVSSEVRRARELAPPPSYFATDPKKRRRSNVDIVAAMHAYLGPILAGAMKAEVSAWFADRKGLTDAERSSELAKIDRQILDCELAEESIIRNAENGGFQILRRAEADPRAVLAHDKVLP